MLYDITFLFAHFRLRIRIQTKLFRSGSTTMDTTEIAKAKSLHGQGIDYALSLRKRGKRREEGGNMTFTCVPPETQVCPVVCK